MLALALRLARTRLTASLAVLVAVLGGAAIVTGTGVLAESGLRSHLPVDRLAGAEVVVSADQTVQPSADLAVALPERGSVPAALADELGELPGVAAAVADVGFPAAVLGTDGDVVATTDPTTAGHGWSSLGLLDDPEVTGTPPTGPQEVALDSAIAAAAGVAPGDTVRVVLAGRAVDARLTAVVPAGTGVLVADDRAARLAGQTDTVDLIGLQVTGDVEAVADAVRPLLPAGTIVSTGDARGDVALPEAAAARSLLVVLASSLMGVPLLIVGFVVAGALAVSIGGQRRELALLRAVGTTPRQLRRLVAGQASVVAAVALVPGIALGYLLAGQFRRLLVHVGVLPDALPLAVGPLPALAAAALLLLVVQVAARCAAWRTSREPVTQLLADSRTGPRTPSPGRHRTGLLLIAAAVPLSVPPLLVQSPIGAASTSLAGIVAAIGLALAGPLLLRRVTGRLARRLPAGTSAPAWLAVANLHGYALRSAGAVTTLAMAVVVALTYTFAQTTVIDATAEETRAGTVADATVTAPALGGIPAGLLGAVQAVPGVESVAPVSSTAVLWPMRVLGEEELSGGPALVLPPTGAGVLDLDVRDGDLADLTGATVAVGSDAAAARDVGIGDQVQLILGDGAEVEARVVAVYDRELGFGSVVLSADMAAGHTTGGLADSLLVRTDGDPATDRALAGLTDRPGVTVSDGGVAGDRPAAPPEVWINLAVIGVLLGYLLLGIANALVAATAQRRGEIAALRLTGTTPRQVRAMMRREAALVSGAAVAAGVLVSVVPLALLGLGFLDRPWPSGPGWLLPVTALVVTGIAFLAIEVPTRAALRVAPADALATQG
ncbi:FtsX-like permease family protein [Modestobacter sp. VKM Ac-2979]|uniref:FtsX-like permease family protein n=1 Tax=unclassified Modestobacter TaxID=2643866 RepID=UPI0022AB5687|nr:MULTISPECIES: FtsX-like permease family protein [unclassified Modestobacter]MCZ2810201.1 FtsX-like permease family protein [Modestobacter sp. VKM Ac-2979]MCZ2841687.1 FtsX-like permease family protein [Modestobacter sp. VKM Ac-2980]